MRAFALTIFAGAFLLFQVQPLIGKYILPWFGGGPGVWTTCMLFFQMLLLGGYAYAHTISRKLPPRTQAIVHLVLLAAALASLPITPGDGWKSYAGGGDPTWHILSLLTVSLGLPYLVLSATGPLMQEWFRRTTPGVAPYRLYALSNAGSLLALISYPFYFETNLTRNAQAQFWSWGLVFYALCCAFCAWKVWRQPAGTGTEATAAGADVPGPTGYQRLLWLLLPASASILLLAVTNKICLDVAVIPFLWVLPLALYLVSFIICFDSPRWYSRFYYTLALVAAMVAVCQALFEGADMAIVKQVAIYCATMFVGCMICHGELYRLRPHPQHLTAFYLTIAAGGAMGGLFVALAAPNLFDNYYEMHLSLGLVAVLLLVVSIADKEALSPRRWRILFWMLALAATFGASKGYTAGIAWLRSREAQSTSPDGAAIWTWLGEAHWLVWMIAAVLVIVLFVVSRRRARPIDWHRLTCGLLGAGVVALGVALAVQIENASRGALLSARNFYGVSSVVEYDRGLDTHYYLLLHGRITHGIQFAAPERAGTITSYFGANSGIGLALRNFPRQQNQRIGLLGLGVGTVAAYGKPGDYFRIYEIDPHVKELAENPFSYLARSAAKVEIVMGDGRLSMESEPPQNFDFLIMDAFSSDAVPVHLLTKEAFEIYLRHLKPDGVILVNVTNRFVDLRPVIENAARAFELQFHHVDSEDGDGSEEDGGWWLYGSTWMILSRNGEFMDRPALRNAASAPVAGPNAIPLWTDDYASMFKVLK